MGQTYCGGLEVLGAGVAGVAGAAGVAAALPNILNITVPQVGHLPLIALRPFFMVSSTPSAMGFLALHLTQYPSDIKIYRQSFMRRTVTEANGKGWQRQFERKPLQNQ